MQYMELRDTVPLVMGARVMNSLMLQVPAIMHSASGLVTHTARPQASTSNMPAAQGVPTARPVWAAAASVTPPQIWAE